MATERKRKGYGFRCECGDFIVVSDPDPIEGEPGKVQSRIRTYKCPSCRKRYISLERVEPLNTASMGNAAE